MINTKLLNYVAIISFVGLLSACGGGNLSKTSTLSGGEGLMLVKIISNSVLNDPEFPHWHTMTLKRTDVKPASLVTLKPNATMQGYANTLTFARSLPAGKYLISTLSSNSKTKPNSLLVKKFGLAFEIKAGHLTNIGNIIHQPQGNLAARKTYSIGHEADDEGAKNLVSKHFPALAKQVFSKPIVHMKRSKNRDRRFRDVMRHAKANSAVLNNMVFNNKGHIYAGGRLGQILRKEFDWERLDTGYNRDISTVRPLSNGKILAGGEDGLLLLSSDKGQTWNELTSPNANSWISFVGENNKGEVFVAAVQKEQVSIFKTNSINAPQWQKLKDINISANNLLTAKPKITITSEQLIVVSDGVHSYNFASQQWDSNSLPFVAENVSQQYTILDDGTILGYRQTGKMNRVFKSVNRGKTWDEQGATMKISSMIFIDGQTGYSVNPKPGAPSEKIILGTRDGGKTWAMVADAPKLVNPKLQADAYNQILYMVGQSGKVFISSDFGQTWSPIRNVAWYE